MHLRFLGGPIDFLHDGVHCSSLGIGNSTDVGQTGQHENQHTQLQTTSGFYDSGVVVG